MSVQSNPQDGGNKKINTAKKGQGNSWIWLMLMANFVFILVLLTLGVMALKVGNVLPDDVDLLYVVGRDPEFETGDEEKTWEQKTHVDIFKTEHVNGENQTTVISQNGDKIIAPGTITTYNFAAYNKGNMAVIYEISTDFILTIGEEAQRDEEFPLWIRLKTVNGKYLIGKPDIWVAIADANAGYLGVLGADSYEEFVLELNWAFDGGNDELDTYYGNMAIEKGITLTFEIESYAEEHIDPTAQGGTRINKDADNGALTDEYGGEVRWFWLILLMINTAILIFYVSFLMKKRLEKR